MQSTRYLSQVYLKNSLVFAHRSSGPANIIGAIRANSSGKSNEDVDLKSYYYPNTDVGIKERSIKPDGPPSEPLQTPYPPFPKGKNPKTGEEGGPTGPEPTRFGDWERKGRVTDF
uniref:Succinate dehydrogenase assembly factor 4, mitochondrial n=1 Tax=Aceria tosichella TaxID=561515 RepID=A0A6G1SHG3_9ACAR